MVSRYRISVMGLGFVGLSLAVVNARNGFDTIGVDIDRMKIDRLRAGRPDFFEPGMDDMLRDSIGQKRIRFTIDLDYAIRNSEITFLTVGTPLKDNGGGVDLSYVKGAVGGIALSVKGKKDFHLLAVKSTIPPLTMKKLILPVLDDLIEDGRIGVVVNPEFLSEGSAVEDLLAPHMIVIGSSDKRSSLMLEEYYRDFYGTPPEIIRTDVSTAELIKYACNAFLATKISFINSISALCQEIPDSDVNTVARAIGKDPRIGPQFLQAGPGFGGSCLPKDLAGLIRFSQAVGKRPDLFQAVKEVNDKQLKTIIEMMKKQGVLSKGRVIAVLGLAFKSGTDDVREAVSVRVVEELLGYELRIKVHDPVALKNFERIFGAKVSYSATVHECLRGSDCCVILTDWDGYKNLKPGDFSGVMRSSNIIDARRALDAREFLGMSFNAVGLGS